MKRFILVAILLSLSGACGGRYYWHSNTQYGYAAYPTAPAQVVVNQPPPPVPVIDELPPPQPSASATWVEGHWSYNGMWTWVGGTWVDGYAGWLWTPPTVVLVNNYYVLHRGYFRQPAYQPAPAYTQPNRIHISVRGRAQGHVAGQGPRHPTPGEPEWQTPERPRQLEVPGAVVRTPPAPATPPTVPPRAGHDATPERPVLVAPGATVSRRPEHTRPVPGAPGSQPPASAPGSATPPPVLSNVPPVVERPATNPIPGAPPTTPTTPPGGHPTPKPMPVAEAPVTPMPTPVTDTPVIKDPGHVATPAPVPAPAPVVPGVQPPAAPPTPPTNVRPGGHAAISSGRVRPRPSAPIVNPAQQARDERERPSSNATPSRGQSVRPAVNVRPTRALPPQTQAAPSRTVPAAPRTQAAPTRTAPAATREAKPREKSSRSSTNILRQADAASRQAGRSRKEPEDKPSAKPAAITCTLVTTEAPRGGQLDVRGEGFGATPVVRIGGKVTRILRRNATEIRVQIPRDSNGGSVTVQAAGTTAECGALTIIGTDR